MRAVVSVSLDFQIDFHRCHASVSRNLSLKGGRRGDAPRKCTRLLPLLLCSHLSFSLFLFLVESRIDSRIDLFLFLRFHRIVSSSDTIDSLPLSFKEFVPFAILSPIQTRISNEGINAHVAGPRWKLDII